MYKTVQVFLISARFVTLDHEDIVHDAPSTHGRCCWVFYPSHPVLIHLGDVMHFDRAEHCLVKREPLPPVRITGQFDHKKFSPGRQVQDMRAVLPLAGVIMCQEVITILSHRDKAKGSRQRYGRDTDRKWMKRDVGLICAQSFIFLASITGAGMCLKYLFKKLHCFELRNLPSYSLCF